MELSSARALGTQVIDSPLREHTHRIATAVVSMWDAYCSFQTEVVGMRWNWACEKTKASAVGTASKASPAPFPSPSTIRKQKGSPPEPLAKRP